MENKDFEVAVIGGSTGGLSAALALGRSERKTIVFDTGAPRNRFSPHAHNFFTRDGTSPLELLKIGRAQLEQYTSVAFKNSKVINAEEDNGLFKLTTDEGDQFVVRRIVLATGLIDILPEIEGFSELWGKKIIHCPYCHGWEARNQPLAIMMNGKMAHHMAVLVNHWNEDLKIFTNGSGEIDEEDLQYWSARNIEVIDTPVLRLTDTSEGIDMELSDGRRFSFFSVYSHAERYQFNNELAIQLGCNISEEGAIVVEESKLTSVKGIFAVGDVSHPTMHQVAFAAAGGNLAGITCNNSLIKEDHERKKYEHFMKPL